MTAAVIVALGTIAAAFGLRLFQIHRQLRKLAGQLRAGIDEKSRERLSLELIDDDLSELAALMNERLEQQERLEIAGYRKEKEFQQMIESLSHDLRTPLTAIKGNLQLLARTKLNEEQNQRLSVISRHAEALEVLIRKFWEYSCAAAEDQKVCFESVDLQTLVIQCAADHIPQFESRGQTVLLQESPVARIWANADFCRRIIENLLQNCLAHAAGRIEIAFAEKADVVILTVQNALAEDQHLDAERIFDRFYTGDSARQRSSGLGLAIVRQLAERQSGSCWAEIKDHQLILSVMFLKDSRSLQDG